MLTDLEEALAVCIRAADELAEGLGSLIARADTGEAVSQDGVAAGRAMLLSWARMKVTLGNLVDDHDGE